jgi:hypothetical protein
MVHAGVTFRRGTKGESPAEVLMMTTPIRHYDRTWEEIEEMLESAQERKQKWKAWFDQCKIDGDREGMMEAARNSKALDGVIKCLRWTLGEEGISHPLD